MGYGRINAYNALLYANSLQKNIFYNQTGIAGNPTNYYQINIISNGCSQIAPANYFVKRYEISTTLTFPFTQDPVLMEVQMGYQQLVPIQVLTIWISLI